jgi:cellulose biosynthesis protein BcsQ
MNVIVFASRKGGSGKSTLTAHLAAYVNRPARRCMLIDCDPQRSISLWHQLRGMAEPLLRNGTRGGVQGIVEQARAQGVEWALVDTPPNMSGLATDAIREATLVVIPVRLAVFDLAAVRETIEFARQAKKPFALILNAVPARRDKTESSFVRQVRELLAELNVPVWGGQITHRTAYSISLEYGQGVNEYDPNSPAVAEITALWDAIERSVGAIHGAYTGVAMHRAAA